MPRNRRRGQRPILLQIPARDGHRVHVRSHTVAERLLGQQHVIEHLAEAGRETTNRLEWESERFRRLRAHPVVWLLCWLRIVKPAPERRPDGWAPTAPVPTEATRAGSAEAPKGLASPERAPVVVGATPTPPPSSPPAQNGRWAP